MTKSNHHLDNPEELQRIAEEAYLYAYPLVLMEVTRRVVTNVPMVTRGRAPMNAFNHARTFPTHRFTAIVRPNADTLYSSLWYDVSKEPLIVNVPDSNSRYYVLTALDMWTDQFSATGTRTTGNGKQILAFARHDWKGQLPDGVEIIRCPTAHGWLLVRSQTDSAADYANVHVFQDGFSATPLSNVGRTVPLSPAPVDPAIAKVPPPMQVDAMTPATFFSIFADVTAMNSPHANDYPVIQRMRQLGLRPGQKFELASQTAAVQLACASASTSARERIRSAGKISGVPGNGWRINLTAMGTYGTDYVRRAAVAKYGLGGIGVEDAVYPNAAADSDGRPLDSALRYAMHFAKPDLPPARAFWSLTMYDQKQYFTENAIGRYAIGDRDPLVYNSDGSLDLHIQRDNPGAGLSANWLPAPQSGRFSMNLRLYWPETRVLDGAWFPPPIRCVG